VQDLTRKRRAARPFRKSSARRPTPWPPPHSARTTRGSKSHAIHRRHRTPPARPQPGREHRGRCGARSPPGTRGTTPEAHAPRRARQSRTRQMRVRTKQSPTLPIETSIRAFAQRFPKSTAVYLPGLNRASQQGVRLMNLRIASDGLRCLVAGTCAHRGCLVLSLDSARSGRRRMHLG
jgi:hypothetical protein